jgi:hypothetical protein
MALAPRPSTGRSKGGGKSSVKSAAGKAQQRARNRANGSGTKSGSSGLVKPMAKYPALSWSEVEDEVEHVVDLALKVTQAQLGANGYFLLSCALPTQYAHAALEAAMQSNDGMLYVRMYKVDIRTFLRAMMDEEEDGDGDTSQE